MYVHDSSVNAKYDCILDKNYTIFSPFVNNMNSDKLQFLLYMNSIPGIATCILSSYHYCSIIIEQEWAILNCNVLYFGSAVQIYYTLM